MYVKSYSNGNTFRIGEHDVPIPNKPPQNEMVNYGLPAEKQFYKPLPTYKDFNKRSRAEKNKIVDSLYHIFWNGRWHLINGQEIYVPGVQEIFCSYWTTENGSIGRWRYEGFEFFLLLEWVEMDPNSYGLLDLKPRRIGDTEKALCWGWWRTVRYRTSRFGMQNKTEADAKENYDRFIKANKKMPAFLRPINRGSDKPGQEIEYSFPEEKISMKKIREGEAFLDYDGIDALDSWAGYGSAVETYFDGQRLSTFHCDEPGKFVKMLLSILWEVVQRCLSFNNGMDIIGKALFTTTVEDIESSFTLEEITKLWNESDPNVKDANGRTVSGLTRIFRSAVLTRVDQYGFPTVEETNKFLDNKIAQLKKRGDYAKITRLKRKHPRTIDEALAVPMIECVLLPALLDNQINKLEAKGEYVEGPRYSNGKPFVNKTVVGDLVWTKGFKSKVKFVANPSGKWHISQMPFKENAVYYEEGRIRPQNKAYYSIGLDPTEYRTSETEIKKIMKNKDNDASQATLSEASLAIYRMYDPTVDCQDNGIKFDENEEILNVDMMETDKFVATWADRPSDPYSVFEETLKACIFYGTQVFAESDKTSVLNSFHDHDLKSFLRWKNRSHMANPLKPRGKTMESGAKATGHIIGLYVDALKMHIDRRIDTCHLLPLLKQFRKFKITNRGQLDRVVAAGYALLGAMDGKSKKALEQYNENEWGDINTFMVNR